jgi:ribosomal protein S21|tara:strand:- start:995 stop:1183 length:189 start_codon:yes stop_codon:yes gene_type:complete
MLIVEVRHENIDGALKKLRRKVKLTKQSFILQQKKRFIKKSFSKRLQLKKAIYKQRTKEQED